MFWKTIGVAIYCSILALNFLYVPWHYYTYTSRNDQNAWIWHAPWPGNLWEPHLSVIFGRFVALLMFVPVLVMVLRKPKGPERDEMPSGGETEEPRSTNSYRLVSPEPLKIM